MADIRIKKIRLGAPSASVNTDFKVIQKGSEPEPQPSEILPINAIILCQLSAQSIIGNLSIIEEV